jgi:hypothetical protein
MFSTLKLGMFAVLKKEIIMNIRSPTLLTLFEDIHRKNGINAEKKCRKLKGNELHFLSSMTTNQLYGPTNKTDPDKY